MRRGYPISVAIAALFFLGVVLPLPANADLQRIIDDYCSEVITDNTDFYNYVSTWFTSDMSHCKWSYTECLCAEAAVRSERDPHKKSGMH